MAVAETIQQLAYAAGRPVLVGLNGSQGSGKSTTAARLAERLGRSGLGIIVCSLDDFYLTKADRIILAGQVHPLLVTRGVPGTHDLSLLEATMSALLTMQKDSTVRVPVFDKAADERIPEEEWPIIKDRVDVVLLEGWCVGARPQPPEALEHPINALERNEDVDGRWRRFVNAHLAGAYADFFSRIDLSLMLRAPSFDCVANWRAEQEQGLDRTASNAHPPMTYAEIDRFIAHYERITRWLLADEPVDLIADIYEARIPMTLRWKQSQVG